jgi:ribokinase
LKESGSRNKGRIKDLLTVIGAINWDVSIFEETFAGLGEEVPVENVEEFSGGKGANVAVAAARLLGPGRTAFIGALGTDDVARRQVDELKKEGILTDGVVTIEGSWSGRAYIVVNGDGRKSIHTHFGANSLVRPSHLRKAGPARVLSRTSMLVVMDTPTDVALAATRKAKRSGARVIYSPGVRTMEGREALADVLDNADVLVLDRAELVRLSGETEEVKASEFLQRTRPGMTVVATSGKGGCTLLSKGRVTRYDGVELSLLGMKAVNSTGSGDSFLGVFASYLSSGASAVEAVKWANLAGALKATKYETRGSPTKFELQEAMKKLETIMARPRSPENRAGRI